MKTVIENAKKGMLMVAMLVASLSFANEGIPFFSITNNAKKATIKLENVKQGNILYIKDHYGVKLYEEVIQINGLFSKGYDLTALENGGYYFELDTETQIKMIPFIVSGNFIEVKSEKTKVIFKPTLRVKGDLVYVSKLALDNEPLKIEVYYETPNSTELVMAETIKGTQNIERVYKLTDTLKSGDYKIVFNTNGREFTKLINN